MITESASARSGAPQAKTTEKGIAHQQMAVIPAQAGDLSTASADQKVTPKQLNEKEDIAETHRIDPFAGWLAREVATL